MLPVKFAVIHDHTPHCSFMELAKSLDPGKTPKTDKASIVADAIRVVTQLRTENSQLQQLNKFLEVSV